MGTKPEPIKHPNPNKRPGLINEVTIRLTGEQRKRLIDMLENLDGMNDTNEIMSPDREILELIRNAEQTWVF